MLCGSDQQATYALRLQLWFRNSHASLNGKNDYRGWHFDTDSLRALLMVWEMDNTLLVAIIMGKGRYILLPSRDN
jgi:hypothetical protein